WCAAPCLIYTLSLHVALPIWSQRLWKDEPVAVVGRPASADPGARTPGNAGRRDDPRSRTCPPRRVARTTRHDGTGPHRAPGGRTDRKSTRLNSSHVKTSYAVF